MTRRVDRPSGDQRVPRGLIVGVTLTVLAAMVVWVMVALQRAGLMGPLSMGVPPAAAVWTAQLHEQFRRECADTLVANLPPIPNPESLDEGTRADVERMKLWLAGACDCIHYRVADRVSYEDAKLVLFGNSLTRAHPHYATVMDNWNICLESNKDIMAPDSPDMQDFRGGVAAQ